MIKKINISNNAEEILEKYWVNNKEKNKSWKMEAIFGEPISVDLVEAGYAKKEGHYLELTKKGWDEARSCVRRHRIAECLLTDVLNVQENLVHDIGCKFEHVLQKEVEENICILLGHPRNCPHGKPIPEGNCCSDTSRKPRKLVLSLDEFEVKEKGKIAYIKAGKGHVMNKLMAMGVIPGLTIQLVKKTPTYLFQMGESQFAIDKNLASHIYIRLS
jgi:DtxR family Mn-dependent transcriptional regulator